MRCSAEICAWMQANKMTSALIIVNEVCTGSSDTQQSHVAQTFPEWLYIMRRWKTAEWTKRCLRVHICTYSRERESVCVFVKERCFVCVYIFIYTFVNVNVCVYIIHESILTRRFSKLLLASISWAWGASSSWANLEMDSRSFARDRGQWDMDENTHVHQAWLSSIMRLL